MDTPIVARRITWRKLRPALTPGPCMLCRRPLEDGRQDEAACERCGRALHFRSCWLAEVATPAERRQFWEGEDFEGIIMLCPACQS
jgi:hypothetical protein